MTLKQKMRKQRKRQIVSKYRQLKWIVEETLYATLSDHYAYIDSKKEYIVPVYMIAIELERKGYKCEIDKPLGDMGYFNITLNIWW
jgi:hypothetical protein